MAAFPLDDTGARIVSTTVADAATAHLRRMLFSGKLEAGQVLRDTTLAKELGIARPTVRTAVDRLVSEGLLEREPGRSARVRTFSADDIRDIFDVRRLIEMQAVRLIIDDRHDTTGIARALEAFRRAGDTWESGPDADARFHLAVVAASASPRLTSMFRGITSEVLLMIGLLRSRYGTLTELYEEHARLLQALERGDRGQALALWSEHISDAESYLIGSLPPAG